MRIRGAKAVSAPRQEWEEHGGAVQGTPRPVAAAARSPQPPLPLGRGAGPAAAARTGLQRHRVGAAAIDPRELTALMRSPAAQGEPADFH